jgi:hypothetical protein
MKTEQYPLEKFIILKIVKDNTDYSYWKIMRILRKMNFSIARSSMESLIRSMVREELIILVLRENIKRKSYSIQITKVGLSKLKELEFKLKITLETTVR